jgi:hypothetical protein
MHTGRKIILYEPNGLGVGVRLLTRTGEMLGSNLGHGICYSEVFRRCSQSLQANAGIVSRFSHRRFLPNPFYNITYLLDSIRSSY